ncbi:MAG TPA: hypothetical protein VGB00_14075 [Pyrinomonadaceae bacterium]|jgi:hypothetical protein
MISAILLPSLFSESLYTGFEDSRGDVWFSNRLNTETDGVSRFEKATPAPETFDTMLAVYTGTDIGNLTHVSSNGDCADNCGINGESGVDLMLTAGQTYYIAVDGVSLNSPAQSGTFTLSLSTYNVIVVKLKNAALNQFFNHILKHTLNFIARPKYVL